MWLYLIEFAQNLEPERLITTSRTPSGSPIITIDGIVVSGNNRTMSLKLAAKNYPEKYKAYYDFLDEEKEALSTYGSSDSGATLGDILGTALSKAKSKKAAAESAEDAPAKPKKETKKKVDAEAAE